MYSNPVKDWFYFTRQQRDGIIVLLVLIIMVPLTGKMVTALRRHQGLDEDGFQSMLAAYYDHLANLEKMAAALEESRLTSGKQSLGKPETQTLHPRPFDPNTLSEEGWQEMGVSARLGRSIHNYLAAGGSFRYKQDLQRIYLMDDDLYAKLKPWISLPDRTERDEPGERRYVGQDKQTPGAQMDVAGIGRSGSGSHQDANAEFKPETGAIVSAQNEQEVNDAFREASHQAVIPDHQKGTISVNINKADSIAFQQIRGIGPVFSRRIVRYRDLLGGYYCTTQLLEVFGMDSTRYAGMLDFIEPDTLLIQQINLNTASFGDLVRHPYIDRPVASAILNLREQHGPFACPADIKSSYLIDESSWERLRPYLHAGKGDDHK